MAARPSKTVAPSQKLTIIDQQLPSTEIPHFSAQADKTITWDAMGLCIEACGDQDGDAVQVSRCTGSANQLWNFVPQGAGRQNQIRLDGSNKCIDVNDERRDLNGPSVELRDCSDTATETWDFEEAIPLPMQETSPWRHVVLSVTAMASLGLLSLAAILKQGQQRTRSTDIARGSALLSGDEGGVCLSTLLNGRQGSVPLTLKFTPAVMAVGPAPAEDGEPVDQAPVKDGQLKASDDQDSDKQIAVMSVTLEKPDADEQKVCWGGLNVAAPAPTADTIDFNNLAQYDQQQLELLYIDVLWAYYQNNKQLLTDEH
jgi:hypothetical protein